jgi:adenylate kinase family enzyme
MKIVVLGPSGSGKSTLLKKLYTSLTPNQVLKIDNFRQRFSDGTYQGEMLAKKKFVDAIIPSVLQFIESTGNGITGRMLVEKLRELEGEKIICVILRARDTEIVIRRVKENKDVFLWSAGEYKHVYDEYLFLNPVILENNTQQDLSQAFNKVIELYYDN